MWKMLKVNNCQVHQCHRQSASEAWRINIWSRSILEYKMDKSKITRMRLDFNTTWGLRLGSGFVGHSKLRQQHVRKFHTEMNKTHTTHLSITAMAFCT
jgi:hypothetical protein